MKVFLFLLFAFIVSSVAGESTSQPTEYSPFDGREVYAVYGLNSDRAIPDPIAFYIGTETLYAIRSYRFDIALANIGNKFGEKLDVNERVQILDVLTNSFRAMDSGLEDRKRELLCPLRNDPNQADNIYKLMDEVDDWKVDFFEEHYQQASIQLSKLGREVRDSFDFWLEGKSNNATYIKSNHKIQWSSREPGAVFTWLIPFCDNNPVKEN